MPWSAELRYPASGALYIAGLPALGIGLLLAIILLTSVLSGIVAGLTNRRNGRYMDTMADKFADRIRQQRNRSEQYKEASEASQSKYEHLEEPFRTIAQGMQRKGLL